MLLVRAILRAHLGKIVFVFNLFASNITCEGTNRPTLLRYSNVMLHFVTVSTIYYLLSSCGHSCSDCCEPVSHRLTAVTCDYKITT